MEAHSSSSPSLEFRLLGCFSVHLGGKTFGSEAIAGRKAPTLLKLLAFQRNHQLVRDRVLDRLWPDLPVEKGAAQLYKSIYHVRQAFSDCEAGSRSGEWIEIADELVHLAPPGDISTDVDQFEHWAHEGLETRQIEDLERAAALYTGDLLPMDLYAEWTAIPRDHLRQLYLDVLLALAEQYRLRGDMAGAAEMFRLALEKDPLLEKAHRGLMQVYALQDQPERAIRQYRTCCKLLEQELAMEASSQTQTLVEEIRQGQFAISRPSVHHRLPGAVQLVPLVGRERECQLIEQVLDQARTHEGRVLTIEGAVGVGKTRLIQELRIRASKREYQALVGKTREMEGAMAYGPFVEIVEDALQESSLGHELIPEEIALAIPSFSGASDPVPNGDRRAAQVYLFSQIAQFFQQRARRCPLVLVLEDMHAADEGSVALLHYLARHSRDFPLLLAITYRSDQGEASLRIRQRLENLPLPGEHVVLEPLEKADHHRLLEQLAGPDALPQERSEQIYRLSEGNPLFARELYRSQAEDAASVVELPESLITQPEDVGAIPPSLQRVVMQRLEELTPPARQLISLAAVMGRTVSFALLKEAWQAGQTAARQSGDPILDLIEELIQAHLLQEQGVDYHFQHALFRAVIYEAITNVRREAFHLQAARGLLKIHTDEETLPVEQIAFHYFKAGDARQAAHYLMRAGERAEAVYAHEDALHRYREALHLLESSEDDRFQRLRSQLYERSGDVNRARGFLEASFDAYEQALESIQPLPVTQLERAELHRKMALSAIYATAMERADTHLQQSETLARSYPKARARALVVRALYHWHLNQLEAAVEEAHEALDLAESLDASVETTQACEMLAMAYLPLGQWEKGMKYEMRRQVQGWSPDIVVATDAHLCLWEYHVHGDEPFDRALSFIEQVSKEARRMGDLRCVAVCHYALGTMQLWRGGLSAAVEELNASLKLHRRVGSPAGMAYALARRAAVHTVEGALEAGWQTLQKGFVHADQAAVRDHCLQRLQGITIWNRIEAGDWTTAADIVAESEELLEQIQPCTWCSLELLPWLALYHLHCQELDRTAAYGEKLEELANMTDNPISQSLTLMVQSGLEQAQGRISRSRQLQGQAVELLQNSVLHGSTSALTHFFDRMANRSEK